MFDGFLRPLIDPPLNTLARPLAARGVGANLVSAAGLVCGLLAALAIGARAPLVVAIVFIVAGRIADGLDGAIARQSGDRKGSDFGGYVDIVFDFMFYGAVPLAFAVRDPVNTLPAAALLFFFYINGASFLAFAVMAAKRRMTTERRGSKSLYFTAGLAEGAETIAVFLAMCLFPEAFPALAYGFGVLCLLTTTSRILLARQMFTVSAEPDDRL